VKVDKEKIEGILSELVKTMDTYCEEEWFCIFEGDTKRGETFQIHLKATKDEFDQMEEPSPQLFCVEF
jgi:hypothetical protein